MNIDWPLLRQQKHTLNELMSASKEQRPVVINEADRQHLLGLLHLCDSLEDDFKPHG